MDPRVLGQEQVRPTEPHAHVNRMFCDLCSMHSYCVKYWRLLVLGKFDLDMLGKFFWAVGPHELMTSTHSY